MKQFNPKRFALVMVLAAAMVPATFAQSPTLGDGPWEFDTVNPSTRIRVSVITKGLTRPWGLAFLPNGDMLVTEMAGTLRIIRDGVLDPDPIEGVPEVAPASSGGLMDIALHPDYETNGLVYFAYVKGGEIPPAPTITQRRCWGGADSTGPPCGTSRTCSSPMPGVQLRAAMARGFCSHPTARSS